MQGQELLQDQGWKRKPALILFTEGGILYQGTACMRVPDWLIGTVSRGGQSNGDVPHSGYFEELRGLCVPFSLLVHLLHRASSSSNPNKTSSLPVSEADVQKTLFSLHDVAVITVCVCGRSGARQ